MFKVKFNKEFIARCRKREQGYRKQGDQNVYIQPKYEIMSDIALMHIKWGDLEEITFIGPQSEVFDYTVGSKCKVSKNLRYRLPIKYKNLQEDLKAIAKKLNWQSSSIRNSEAMIKEIQEILERKK